MKDIKYKGWIINQSLYQGYWEAHNDEENTIVVDSFEGLMEEIDERVEKISS